MITGITLENFKCFRKLEVNPRLITVFVGPNGTGKSSVLQALLLLKQSVGSGSIQFNSGLLNLIGHDRVKPSFEPDSPPLHIRLAAFYRRPGADTDSLGGGTDFDYHFELQGEGAYKHWGEFRLTFDGGRFHIEFGENGEPQKQRFTLPGAEFRLRHPDAIGRLASITSAANDSGLSEAVERYVLESPRRVLENLRIVSAARGLVRTVYQLGPDRVEDVTSGYGLSGQEDQTATNLGYGRDLQERVSTWMGRVTRVGLRADVVPDKSVEVQSLTAGGVVNIVSEGFGTSSLVLLFLQLAKASGGATVMIEEPEIHLHPKAQANLAELLAEVAKAEDKQLIMTTHSEHIVGRLLTLVAEKKLSSEELAIYAFEKDGNGECTAQELGVTEDGRVKGGIKDFFESDLAELNRYVEALQPTE